MAAVTRTPRAQPGDMRLHAAKGLQTATAAKGKRTEPNESNDEKKDKKNPETQVRRRNVQPKFATASGRGVAVGATGACAQTASNSTRMKDATKKEARGQQKQCVVVLLFHVTLSLSLLFFSSLSLSLLLVRRMASDARDQHHIDGGGCLAVSLRLLSYAHSHCGLQAFCVAVLSGRLSEVCIA